MREEVSKEEKLMQVITNASKLTQYYLDNKEKISQEKFFHKYFQLTEDSTEPFFSSICDWYTETFVLPLLIGNYEKLDPVMQSQGNVEEKVLEKELMKDCIVLDVGCGPGRVPFTFHDHRKVKKIYAFDISRQMIEKAQEIKKDLEVPEEKVEFFRADATNLPPLQLESPVIATCVYGTYGNIPREEDRVKALKNMKKNADRIIVTAYNMHRIKEAREYYKELSHVAGSDLVELKDEEDEKTFFFSPKTTFFTTWFTVKGLRKEFRKAGMKPRIKRRGEQLVAVWEKPLNTGKD